MCKKFVRVSVKDYMTMEYNKSKMHYVSSLLNIFVIENNCLAMSYLGNDILVIFSLKYKIDNHPIIYAVWCLHDLEHRWLKLSNAIINKFLNKGQIEVINDYVLSLDEDGYKNYTKQPIVLGDAEMERINELYDGMYNGNYKVKLSNVIEYSSVIN